MTGLNDQHRLLAAAQKIADALNEADAQEFHVIVDEDGDGGVTVWSADREDWAEAVRPYGNDQWKVRCG